MDIGITKMSTKGQIVIPSDLRSDFKVGEKLVVIKENDRLIIRKVSTLDKQFAEDIEFAIKTEEAWENYDQGKFKSMDFDDFIKEMKKW